MKIKEISTILTCPDRNYLIVKIVTEDGITGYGDATLNGRELSVKSIIDNYLSGWLNGRDADRIEDIWQMVFRGTYWRGGPVLMTALAGIDMALWDIKGKYYNAPLYSLLGGKCRNKLKAYFHVHGRTKEKLLERANQKISEGCKVLRYSFDTEDPLIAGSFFCQPHQDIDIGERIEVREDAINNEKLWDSDSYVTDLIQITSYIRENIGYDIGLIHDVHHRLTPIKAAAIAKSIEKYNLLFLEDPIDPMNKNGLKVIRNHSTTPIGVGEIYNTVGDCLPLLENQLIDYLRVDISHFGGISPLKKAASLSEVFGVKTAFHGPSDISPIAHAAMAHVGFSVPNFGIQEHVYHGDKTFEIFSSGLKYREGYLHIEDRPGIGVDVNEEIAYKYQYKRSFLPILRDREGAVHNW